MHLKLHRQFQALLFQLIPLKLSFIGMVDVNDYGNYPKSSHPLRICSQRDRIMYISFIIHTYVIRLKWSCFLSIIAIQIMCLCNITYEALRTKVYWIFRFFKCEYVRYSLYRLKRIIHPIYGRMDQIQYLF